MKKKLHRIMADGAYKIQVFCEEEIYNYSSYFGVPIEKFVWLPYCTELNCNDYNVIASPINIYNGDYLFTGGLHNRDYETLYYAVKDLPIEIKIAAPKDQLKQELISSNMTILGVISEAEYYRIMANSKLVVLSLDPGVRRFPGVITYVSAMALGKPVVVNDPHGARSYIPEGTGVLVEPRNPTALRNAIRTLLFDNELRIRLSESAYLHAQDNLSLTRLSMEIERLACEACNEP